ncbi:MAG: hypothetical protein AAFP15_15770 [Bacteroidota bacterium]
MSEQVMTKQEIFDAVVKGLAKQGRPATMPRLRCGDGSRCAIGLLLTDEEISGHPVMTCNVAEMNVPARMDVGLHFLDSIQSAHDYNTGSKDLKGTFQYLREVAEDFGLSTKAIDEATSGQG